MPVGPGHLTLRYAFAAAAAYGNVAPDVALPDCSVNHPPSAEFTFTPAAPGEGRVVMVEDHSTDLDNDIEQREWSFGDGTSSRPQPCGVQGRSSCHIYAENGTYTIMLSVKDSAGATASKTRQLIVGNLPPESDIDDAQASEGQTLRLSLIHI